MAEIQFSNLLDRASGDLLRMEEQKSAPVGLRVHPDMYAAMSALRRKEMDYGCPLLVLGLPVLPEETLGLEDYRIVR